MVSKKTPKNSILIMFTQHYTEIMVLQNLKKLIYLKNVHVQYHKIHVSSFTPTDMCSTSRNVLSDVN